MLKTKAILSFALIFMYAPLFAPFVRADATSGRIAFRRVDTEAHLIAGTPLLGVGEPALAVNSGAVYIGTSSGNRIVGTPQAGATGPTGAAGTNGTNGAAGATGAQGIQGATGTAGSNGAAGSAGASGARGSLEYTGSGAPGVIAGVLANDLYLNTANGDVYTYTASWGSPVINLKGPTGATGAAGPQGTAGSAGASGTNGTNGAAATIAAGTATALASGASPTVTNSGTSSAATFNFGIPAGATGPQGTTGAAGPTGSAGPAGSSATIAVGTTTTGAAGSSATVTNSGTSSAATFNFTIPQGVQGSAGATGAAGPAGATGPSGSGGGGPAGTDTQTLNYNGTVLTATSSILNNGSQVTVGGAIDTGARLSVNPQQLNENGLSVHMPNVSPTGFAIQVKGATSNIVGNTISSDGKEITLQQTGDDYGATSLKLTNRNGANGAIFTNSGLPLVDFIFNAQGSAQNIRYEARNSYTFLGSSSEFQFGTPNSSSGFNQTGPSLVTSSLGTVVARGGLYVGTADSGSAFIVNSQSPTKIGATIELVSGQVADGLGIVSSTKALLLGVDKAGHLKTGGTIPTAAAGANASSAAITAGSTDMAGNVTQTAIASPTAAAKLISVTFATAYSAAPNVVQLQARNAATSSLSLYVQNVTASGFEIWSASAPAASASLAESYLVIQ